MVFARLVQATPCQQNVHASLLGSQKCQKSQCVCVDYVPVGALRDVGDIFSKTRREFDVQVSAKQSVENFDAKFASALAFAAAALTAGSASFIAYAVSATIACAGASGNSSASLVFDQILNELTLLAHAALKRRHLQLTLVVTSV
jgi:hypothetical protein